MASQVSERGQITIDRMVRRQLGIRPGMVAYQRVVGGHLEVIFLPEPHRRSLYGVFHHGTEQPQAITTDELEEAVMEAISAEQEQAWDGHA
jgi:bifunctional DNA-binding transcriptional regulator/antitoxin component of YhaV-PrlF toxin-antitoxin module